MMELSEMPGEMRALYARMRQNYYEPHDPHLFVDVGNFFLQHPEPKNSGLREYFTLAFVKVITKIASHSLDERLKIVTDGILYPESVLFAAMAYCTNGVERIERSDYAREPLKYAALDVERMHLHLYAHRARFANALAGLCASIDERVRLHEYAIASNETQAMLAERYGVQDEIASAHFYVANDCKMLAAATSPRDFLSEAADHYAKSAAYYEGAQDFLAAGYAWSLASDAMFELAKKTFDEDRKKSILEQAIAHAVQCTTLVDSLDKVHCAMTHSNIGKFYQAKYEISGVHKDIARAMQHYRKALQYFEKQGSNTKQRTFLRKRIYYVRAQMRNAQANNQNKARSRPSSSDQVKKKDQSRRNRREAIRTVRDELMDLKIRLVQ